MILKFKKLDEDAVMPIVSEGNAGIDLTVNYWVRENEYIEYGFGLAVEIPKGYFGLLFPRSSITKMNLMLKNSVGVIDSSYTGEIKARFKIVKFDDSKSGKIYQVGERAAQLIILPCMEITIEEVTELTETERGDKGFGSTGL